MLIDVFLRQHGDIELVESSSTPVTTGFSHGPDGVCKPFDQDCFNRLTNQEIVFLW